MEIKRWKTANFVPLGKPLQQGYGASIVVLVGSDSEQAASIVNRISNVQILPRGKLRALADLMVAADKARSLKFLRRLMCQVSPYLNLPGTVAMVSPSLTLTYKDTLNVLNVTLAILQSSLAGMEFVHLISVGRLA